MPYVLIRLNTVYAFIPLNRFGRWVFFSKMYAFTNIMPLEGLHLEGVYCTII